MKKLNKVPSIDRTVRHRQPEGYKVDYSFVFSEELPYLRAMRERERKQESRRRV